MWYNGEGEGGAGMVMKMKKLCAWVLVKEFEVLQGVVLQVLLREN